MKKKFVLIISILIILSVSISVGAATIFRSFIETKGTYSTGSVEKVVDTQSSTSPVEIYSQTESITFEKADDTTNIPFEIRNRTSSIIKYSYKFKLDGNLSKEESLASSILVYYNNNVRLN